ncbi:hypothetical protein CQW23_33552 [Capsicum baccatum]|uniref:Uncharacterized protein n=1 Tax=Capsicum baccatum TaxID=33114 RepID=A0A2G2V1F1_CAPBA|nr:hypothetical protein CQW23_33552 [Capsicum baccatum]
MSIAEFVLISGDFMGEWVETSKYWKWRSFTKVTILIPVRRNSLYDEFVASVMPILRINVVERSFEGPLNSSAPPPRRPVVDNDLIDDDLSDYENDVDDTINMEVILCIWKTFHRTRKMMKKTIKRNHKQDTHSPTEPISVVVKHSPIKKS